MKTALYLALLIASLAFTQAAVVEPANAETTNNDPSGAAPAETTEVDTNETENVDTEVADGAASDAGSGTASDAGSGTAGDATGDTEDQNDADEGTDSSSGSDSNDQNEQQVKILQSLLQLVIGLLDKPLTGTVVLGDKVLGDLIAQLQAIISKLGITVTPTGDKVKDLQSLLKILLGVVNNVITGTIKITNDVLEDIIALIKATLIKLTTSVGNLPGVVTNVVNDGIKTLTSIGGKILPTIEDKKVVSSAGTTKKPVGLINGLLGVTTDLVTGILG